MVAVIKTKITVDSVEFIGGDVVVLEFKYSGRPVRFKSGQFIHLALDEYDPSKHWPESRPFTIASAPKKDRIRLIVSREGEFTSRMFDELNVGSDVWVKGPYGKFIIEDDEDQFAIMIAGGTGISPFLSYLEGLERYPRKIGMKSLYYSVKTSEKFVKKDFFKKLEKSNSQFQFYPNLTQENVGVNKRISIGEICGNLDDLSNVKFYLCGPLEMVVDMKKELASAYGVDDASILYEEW